MNVQKDALALYRRYITETGFSPPATYAELLLFVALSGAPVVSCRDAPPEFYGIQIGEIAFVNDDPELRDRKRMLILAHEWCHWLRRNCQELPARARMYHGDTTRDREERIAKEFERLF